MFLKKMRVRGGGGIFPLPRAQHVPLGKIPNNWIFIFIFIF